MNLIGFLGIQRDKRGWNANRWKEWRPSVAAVMQNDILIQDYYLIYPSSEFELMRLIKSDIETVSPSTNVIPVLMDLEDEFEPLSVLDGLMSFLQEIPRNKEYLISLATGTHVSHMVWFDIVRRNILNAKLLQLHPLTRDEKANAEIECIQRGKSRCLDMNMARYSNYNVMLEEDTRVLQEFLKDGVITQNKEYNQLISTIERVALRNNMPILIDGKTGAGKTQLAKRLFSLKKDKGVLSGDFKYINCATLRPETAQSVLFGHVKGSFTGASSNRVGLLKAADQGALFLDEIATLPLDVQGMLLHALEEKSFMPMGSDTPVSSDFCLISGTNVNLLEAVEKGAFREDLLARIDCWHFTLPSLSERPEDIEPNVDVELAKYEHLNGDRVRFQTEARKSYLNFAMTGVWKRNFRDLSASITRLATLAEGNMISEEDVQEEILRLEKSWGITNNKSRAFAAQGSSENLLGKLGIDVSSKTLAERAGLEAVIKVCMESTTAKEAGLKAYPNSQGVNIISTINNYLSRATGMKFKQIKELLNEHGD
ncbi:RNA repair transcriptional activator RtcR family protein [Vibrio sp. D431a]|uniref:RNA repair transcriptional activator RtcR family protein n=1 Tax=Vibrio sp. D431a TaxID=2837388 RepID=UPI00255280C0|nr:RNA repair transcriptional activator RtcR family protein [Vibrio sp. D431a]MDK9790010.1 sigma 54-interacting transcriptional regulator [Vibrio sp. D431a]